MSTSEMLRLDCSRLGRRLLHALRLPPREMLTTARVVTVIVLVELLIRWVPLPRLAHMLGLRLSLAPPPPGATRLPLKDLSPRARRELRCTRRIADRWPFSRGPCLRRAIVAGHLLRRYDPAVRLGVAGTGDDLHAHAWLEIDGRPLENVGAFDTFQNVSSGVTG